MTRSLNFSKFNSATTWLVQIQVGRTGNSAKDVSGGKTTFPGSINVRGSYWTSVFFASVFWRLFPMVIPQFDGDDQSRYI